MLMSHLDFKQNTIGLSLFQIWKHARTSLVTLCFCSTQFVERLLIPTSQNQPAASGWGLSCPCPRLFLSLVSHRSDSFCHKAIVLVIGFFIHWGKGIGGLSPYKKPKLWYIYIHRKEVQTLLWGFRFFALSHRPCKLYPQQMHPAFKKPAFLHGSFAWNPWMLVDHPQISTVQCPLQSPFLGSPTRGRSTCLVHIDK